MHVCVGGWGGEGWGVSVVGLSCVCVGANVCVCICHSSDRKKIFIVSKDKNTVLSLES